MALPDYSPADFVAAMQALLPRGRVWPRDPDAFLTLVLQGLAGMYARSSARAGVLLVDAFPATTYELLPEWEASLGLPDPCAGATPALQDRRNQVLARFAAGGGQSVAFLIAYAAALGYVIDIEILDNFTFAVVAPLESFSYFRVGQSAVGDALTNWGNAVLECEIEAVKPAHTTVEFHYV